MPKVEVNGLEIYYEEHGHGVALRRSFAAG